MNLFLKVNRVATNHAPAAWTELRAKVLGPGRWLMSEAEAGEFEFLLERKQHSALGAGGQFEYRVYELADNDIQWPYAIVFPTVQKVREQYPFACRVMNLDTGTESSLLTGLDEAHRVVFNGLAKRLLGSFR